MKKKIVLFSLLFITLLSYNKINRDRKVDKDKLLSSDYRLFQNTPAWNLAKAVWDNNPKKVDEEVKKNPKIINYQDPLYGKTLLHLSIYNGQFKSFQELLKLGANPNIHDSLHCTSPIIQACQDFDNKIKYVEELIKHGANVNDMECLSGTEKQKTKDTPLGAASSRGNLKLVRLLVEKGAKLNSNGEQLSRAILQEHYSVVLYLLKQGADCNKILYKKYNADNSETPIYIKDLINTDENLRSSKEYSNIKNILIEKGCL